jgi:hypothetical protein
MAFHRYAGPPLEEPAPEVRTPAAEHLVEALHTVRDGAGRVRVHFTVSPEAAGRFAAHVEAWCARLEGAHGVRFEVTYSSQEPATDTLALDGAGRPARTAEGALLLRPGGHGALLGNLERTGGDIVFVKNIDNVAPDRLKEETHAWKRLLCGYLLRLQGRLFALARRLEEAGGEPSPRLEEEVLHLLADPLGRAPLLPAAGEARRRRLLEALRRPLRVCGVVPNTGEPGGGPFWIDGGAAGASLQIVERSQIDEADEGQRAALEQATHFNPVDLVCALRDERGAPYSLDAYREDRLAFVSEKSAGGHPLRALERPGLWNGAMARWNTAFVEVPLGTFHPVKTVFDLLRPEHQPG